MLANATIARHPRRALLGVSLLILTVIVSGVGLWLYAEQLDDGGCGPMSDQVEVVRAARSIPAGRLLSKADITTTKVPMEFYDRRMVRELNLNFYLGKRVKVVAFEGGVLMDRNFGLQR